MGTRKEHQCVAWELIGNCATVSKCDRVMSNVVEMIINEFGKDVEILAFVAKRNGFESLKR